MPNYKFLLNNTDITNGILNFSYTENLEDVATSFNFSSLEDFDITSNVNGKDVLNQISIIDKDTNTTCYIGYIFDVEHTVDKRKYNYSGFDVGVYLNKNEVIKQFKNANIGDAIEALCGEYQVNWASKPTFKANVSKIYKDVVFADILKEFLELEKTKGGNDNLYIDCKQGKLNILEYQLEPNLSSLIANHIQVNSHDSIADVRTTKSILELKNRVIYSNDDAKSVFQVKEENTNSIAKYGLLTTVETIDTNKNNNLKQLAKTKLNELDKITETYSIGKMLGDYRVGKGKLIRLTVQEYGLIGYYLIKSTSHNIDNKKEIINLGLDFYRAL